MALGVSSGDIFMKRLVDERMSSSLEKCILACKTALFTSNA